MPKGYPCTVHLKRHRFLDSAGGGTIWCAVTHDGGDFGIITRLKPGQFPEFAGDEAWFSVVKYPKHLLQFCGSG